MRPQRKMILQRTAIARYERIGWTVVWICMIDGVARIVFASSGLTMLGRWGTADIRVSRRDCTGNPPTLASLCEPIACDRMSYLDEMPSLALAIVPPTLPERVVPLTRMIP